MDYPRYDTEISLAYDIYEFMSVGKKGAIPKCILFYQNKKNPNLYSCILGDIKEDGSIDTKTVTDNGDMPKVLSTVVSTTILFLSQYSDCQVIIKGSNKTRTRLYRMAINTNYDILSEDFEIYGVFEPDEISEVFIRGTTKDYDYFLVNQK